MLAAMMPGAARAADEGQRLVAGELQMFQHHNSHQVPDMQ